MKSEWINALAGGALIGLSATLMLLLNGRVTGISGILNGTLFPTKNEFSWRFSFVIGLLGGGFLLKIYRPESFGSYLPIQTPLIVIAGLLVGFGTIMGSGCTSGHGICGISRFSIRSIIATLTFISAGILSVFFFKNIGIFQ